MTSVASRIRDKNKSVLIPPMTGLGILLQNRLQHNKGVQIKEIFFLNFYSVLILQGALL